MLSSRKGSYSIGSIGLVESWNAIVGKNAGFHYVSTARLFLIGFLFFEQVLRQRVEERAEEFCEIARSWEATYKKLMRCPVDLIEQCTASP